MEINDKDLKKRVKNDLLKFEKYWSLPRIEQTIKKLKNISKLGLNPEKVLVECLNEKNYNLDSKKPLKFNASSLLNHDIKSLKRGAKYIFTLDRLLGIFFKIVPNYSLKRLRTQFMNNFADFGLILCFAEFCYKRNIKILEYEPTSPDNKTKKLDFKILLNQREVFVECFSPIESMVKGKNIEDKIYREIEKHDLQYFNHPLIFVINISEPSWSKNFWNRGFISDEMFEPIRRIERYEIYYPKRFYHLSAVIIKYWDIGKVFLNFTLWNPLMPKEMDILTSKHSIFRRIFENLRRFY